MTHFYLRICKNGHYEIDYRRAKDEQGCRMCSEKLIDACPSCGRLIKEWHFYGTSMMPPKAEGYKVPAVCPNCGEIFPWSGKECVRVPNRQNR